MPTTSPEPRRCPRCGSRVAQQADRCVLCGQELRSSGYLQPALALIAVAIVVGVAITALHDRVSGGNDAARAAATAPSTATALAIAQATVPVTPDTPTEGPSAAVTATAVAPTPSPTAQPTQTATPTPVPSDTLAPTAEPSVYLVKSGDVLSTIAAEHGLDVQDILNANPGLTENSMLSVDQEIVIPSASGAATTPVPTATPQVHKIESGDSLAYLAGLYDTTVDAILSVNPGLTEYSTLRIGQEVVIPGGDATGGGDASAEPTATPPQSFEHALESGETIGYLASQYGTTTEAILEANPGLTRYTILSVGQVIVIPVPPQSGGPEPTEAPSATPAPTATPDSTASMVAATAAPTASLLSMGGPAQPYAVEALSPGGGTQVKSSELILMWTGAGDLSSDLYYVVHVWQVGEPSDTLTGWTRASSWRPTEDLIARWGAGAHLYWDVGIGREIAVAGSGQPRFESAGTRTEPQDFYVVAN